MKQIFPVLTLVCGVGLAANAFAQQPNPQRPAPQTPTTRTATATLGVPIPLPGPVDVEIKDQPDSPIHITVDAATKERLPGTPLRVRNDSGSTVAAYVLRVDVDPYGYNQMVFLGPKGLAAGADRVQGLAPWNNRDGTSSKHTVSIDLVQFADGKTWGDDSLGRSKDVAAYLKGRNDTLARLQEMLAGQDASEIMRALDTFSSSSFAEPFLPGGRPPRYIDYSVRGFEEVINILRRMPRNTELGRDLAARLEAAAKRPDQ
jgi:hypothetical protein